MAKKYTIKEMAELSGKSVQTIYKHANRLGKIPTLKYLQSLKAGRPSKY